ncbi:DUF2059 domain-containing protein [Sphingomonas hengshuiensis]|uniref:DUF2059 domain-containing protein n=1 Tax=Sphingomonas hengshuiensis TaxID=1609977 RepID=A0A7U4JBF6_9SPHN|nr:DUF2059 domain-containing protein [Sphingomonas hengshuiensis]AJP73750.1 hypothetical protein TS85_21045 [Sphingomonas hengshuiensis]
MKSLLAAFAVATAALLPSTAQARGAPIAVAPSPDVEQLVAMLVGDDAMLRLGTRAFDANIEEELAADPQAKALLARDPGLKTYVSDQLRASFVAVLQRELPTLRGQLGTLFASELTATEVADTLAFFSSPVGRKLIAQVYQAAGDTPGQDQAAMQQAAIASVMANLQPEDYPALMAFGASSAAQKMQVVNPKISATSQAWAEKLVSANEAAFRQQAIAAVADYMAKQR